MSVQALPKRKSPRLQNYNYAQNGAYFVTICTHDKKPLFGNVGADSISARMITDIFTKTIDAYKNVYCTKYVVMPNHFHAIVEIERADMESAPTLSEIMQTFKRHTTIEYIKLVKQGTVPPFDKKVWQRSFYDHVIRNEEGYQKIWQYIDTNPAKWADDRFYVE